MKRIWIVICIIVGLVAISTVGYFGFRSTKPKEGIIPQAPDTTVVDKCDVEQSVTAPGMVSNTDTVSILMPVDATIDKIIVRPGDAVKRGDKLAKLLNDPIELAKAQVALAEAKKKLSEAKNKIAELKNTYSPPERVEFAYAKLAIAKSKLDDATLYYNSTLESSREDPVRANAYIELSKTQNEYDKARIAYDLTLGYSPIAVNVAIAEANLALAVATVDKAQNDFDMLSSGFITSPFDGIILDNKAETQKKTTSGTYLFLIHNPSNIEVAATVVEEDLQYVKVGQKVDIFFDAIPDSKTTGAISRILPKRASTERPLYTIYIKLDNIPNNLFDGMTADAAIEIAKREQVLCLPRAIVHASSGDSAIVKVWNGQKTEERKIKIGLRGDIYLEILSGLEKGEQVVTR
jgi:multidrug efflux pump subunit AcrA (membrane-fusion protein)